MSRHLLHHKNLQQLIEHNIDFVSVVIVDMKGSAPQEPGAKMLVTQSSNKSPHEGTIGGGKLELFAIDHALDLLKKNSQNTTETLTLNLQTDIGMTCGGVVQLFFETYRHDQWHIAVFGAGHVAQALIPVLLTLSCEVHCIDDRTEWLEKLPQHKALTIHNQNKLDEVVKNLPVNCYIVSVTQGHCEDVKIILSLLANRTPPYMGIIGSDSKAAILKKELKSAGVKQQLIDQIQCPIGLPFGQDIPSEIAISITAQLLEHRDLANPIVNLKVTN